MSSNKTGAHPEASTVHAVGGTVTSADATAAAALTAVHERTASGSSLLPTLPPATVTSSTAVSDSPSATAAASPANTPNTTPPPSAAAAATANPSVDTDKGADPTSEKQNHPHHVIFVVHGMGRQLEEFGNYERNVGHLVENTRQVLQNQFFEHRTDVHIIPIEWHAKLHSMVDQRMSLASLKTVPKDFNSHYGGEITKFIVDELNEAYTTFIAKHPHFNGKIAIYALSLGGVAMYDILTCQDDIEDDDEDEDEEKEEEKAASSSSSPVDDKKDTKITTTTTHPDTRLTETQMENKRLRKENSYKYRAIMHKLKFRPHYLFTVGSPVGAVMVMRNLDWSYFHPPDDIIHHNLFHPFDPLGYRVEPLIDSVFSMIPPVTMTQYSASQSILPMGLSMLPSLPSLSNLPIPDSISSFWGQKVPAIPRPSFRTIAQVAQTLKAASWRSSNSSSSSMTDTANNTAIDTGDQSTLPKDVDMAVEEEAAAVLNGSQDQGGEDENSHDHPHDQVPSDDDDKELMTSSDADATAGEAIVAAAAFAYFDRDPSNRAPPQTSSSSSLSPASANGLAGGGSGDGHPRPGRRPSLGPRKISNRRDLDANRSPTEEGEEAVSSKKLKATVEDAMEDEEEEEEEEDQGTVTPARKEEDRPAPKLDDVLDRHQSKEKARASAAASPLSSSPTTTTSTQNHHPLDRKNRRPSISSTRTNRERTYPFPLLVQGRSTAVPYRIDHTLQETKVDQYTNEYLLGMRSHFRYWANRDIAYHILKHLLHEPGKKPLDDEQHLPEAPLDLQLNMPTPVKTPRGVREAAEAKAKLAGAALLQQQQNEALAAAASVSSAASGTAKGSASGSASTNTTATSTLTAAAAASAKDQRRYSSSYSSTLNLRRQEHDEEDFMMGRDLSMQGYRFNDLDVNMTAAVGGAIPGEDGSSGVLSRKRPSTTLFQNSPFSGSSGRRVSGSGEVGGGSSLATAKAPSTTTTTTITTTTSPTMATNADLPTLPPPAALSFDDGVVHVPDLRRPARLHRRSLAGEQ
ncbi:Phospholipase ddhd1 [Actinomortierella ambigua]|nr:Phospholipase ddhd1 [Actinomortierella ambigua]